MIYEVLKYIRADFKDNNLLIVKAMPTLNTIRRESGAHSFQIHENAVYPYKPHKPYKRICKGIRPYSSLFVLIRA